MRRTPQRKARPEPGLWEGIEPHRLAPTAKEEEGGEATEEGDGRLWGQGEGGLIGAGAVVSDRTRGAAEVGAEIEVRLVADGDGVGSVAETGKDIDGVAIGIPALVASTQVLIEGEVGESGEGSPVDRVVDLAVEHIVGAVLEGKDTAAIQNKGIAESGIKGTKVLTVETNGVEHR